MRLINIGYIMGYVAIQATYTSRDATVDTQARFILFLIFSFRLSS